MRVGGPYTIMIDAEGLAPQSITDVELDLGDTYTFNVALSADQIEEITVFTLIFQGIAYICMMGVANLFYNLGALSEKWLQLSDPGSYRRSCFRLGYRFSFALPFSVPVLLLLKGILMSLR